MSYIVEQINRMDELELILFLSRRTITYLLDLYNGVHGKNLNLSAKNYIRVLEERQFLNMYELDLYAYLRIFTTNKCVQYYIDEGVMNKKNMPYLPMVLEELDIDDNILDNYVDQYEYYPDGMGFFTNRSRW